MSRINRQNTPDAQARQRAVRAALLAKLAELGHDTEGDAVDGFTLFEIVEQRRSGYHQRENTNRLRIKVTYHRIGYSSYHEPPRQFPEPNKGFEIAKIAGVVSEHVKAATQLRDHEEQRKNNDHAGRQLLWRTVRSFGLPEDSCETSHSAHTTTSELVEKHPDQLRNEYKLDGEHGGLKLVACSHSGTVTASVAVKAKSTAELRTLIERLAELAGVEHHVCDRDALAVERKAEWESREKGNNDD